MPPPTTVPFDKVIVKLVKLSTKVSGFVTLMFILLSELTSLDNRYRSMSFWAVDAALMSWVCSKIKSTATRANSKTRATVPLTDAVEEDAEVDADVADAVDLVVVAAVVVAAVCMAPAASAAAVVVVVGTLRIGGT